MVRGGGVEQKGKRTHGHGQEGIDSRGEGRIRELNGSGKNVTTIIYMYVCIFFKAWH